VLARLILTLACAIASGVVGAVPPATAAPVTADVSPTTLPPSARGRLAYSTAIYEASPTGSGMMVHGLGTIGLDGGDQRTLTDPQPVGDSLYAGYDHSPQWSPDGTWLAYLQDRPGPVGGTVDSVAVIPRDGGDPQIIDPHGLSPAWSPDGRHLAWVSVADDGSRSIGIADVKTTPVSIKVTNPRTLEVPEPTQPLGPPTFSPDGQSLAFMNGDYHTHQTVLYTISTIGEDLRQVSHGVAIEFASNTHAFSPDGTRLMFLATTEDAPTAPQTYLVDADGTDQYRISPAGPYTESAVWAPTGEAIAMTTSEWRLGILLVGLDGQELGSLAQDKFSRWGGLTFSPDGSRIYSVAAPAEQSQWAPDLYAIPVNGEEPQRLTFDHSVFPDTVQAIDPGRVLRQFGDGATDTAASAVSSNVDTADTLVVSPVNDYAASLTAAPLAAQLGAPALVSQPDSLSPQVVQATDDLHVSNVVLVGRLSSEVGASLRAAGLNVSRVGNTTSPYRVSAAVASHLSSHQAFMVPVGSDQPGGWKLTLATAGLAAFKHKPLLYSTQSTVPTATRSAIQTLGITSVTVIGGDKDVSPRLLHQLARLGVTVHRVRSSDRYAISAQFAERAVATGARTDHPIVSSGAGWASSVTAPALAALLGQVTVLVDSRTVADSGPTAAWVRQHRRTIRTVKLLGGVHMMRPLVEVQLEHRIQ
jgi:Tol biopolymer transport system component